VPPIQHDLEAFLEAINAAVTDKGYEIVFGAGDAEVLGLSFGRDRISARVPYASHEDVVRAFDKFELSMAARRVGLCTPETVVATEEALARVKGPVVVKPRLHWTPGVKGAPPRLEVRICPGRAEAIRRASEIHAAGGEPLLQEVIRGYQMYYTVVSDRDGRIISGVQQVAEPLAWPPGAGVRVRSKTVPVDEWLKERVSELVKDLGWFGLATPDFLVPEDGIPRLKDFNGRFTESFEQVLAAGSNLPVIWGCLATGREVPRVVPATTGVRFQWLEGDLRRALVERRGGLVRDILECLLYARGAAHPVWRKDDPWPAIRYSEHLLRRAVGKLGRFMRYWLG
jgi:predicted ATP-grasp superfamily ATP-dependent carboligase